MAIGDKKAVVMQSDIVNDFTTGGATNVLSAEMGKSLAQRSNPNLLDNWYFGNPVDQRGGYVVPPGTPYWKFDSTQIGTTSQYYKVKELNREGWGSIFEIDGVEYNTYSYNAVRGYTEAGYGLDRWSIPGYTDQVICIMPDCIRLKSTGNYGRIIQKIPADITQYIKDKTVTISLLTKNTNPLMTVTRAFNTMGGGVELNFDFEIYTTIEDDGTSILYLEQIGNNVNTDIIAVKLELGTHQTLAHQDENGNWVLNEIPDYNEELVKCRLSKADSSDTYANKSLNEAVDAAPAGFGWGVRGGKRLPEGTDLNNIMATGLYTWEGYDLINAPSYGAPDYHPNPQWGQIFVENCFQYYLSWNHPDLMMCRYLSGDTWTPWEWVNPPMQLNAEYRTTERHLGKPVYTKLVNFGELPNASAKDYVAGDTTCNPIRVSGYVYKTGKEDRFETIDGGILPTSSVQSDYNDVWISAIRQVSSSGSAQTDMIIHIRTRKDFSGKSVRVQVWYTKTTD